MSRKRSRNVVKGKEGIKKKEKLNIEISWRGTVYSGSDKVSHSISLLALG